MRHLLVTNDFPPKVGGIQTYLWELWRRLPPEAFAVLTTAHPDAPASDAAQPFRVERVPGTVLWPTPDLRRRIDRLAAELDAGFVVLDPALPLGAVGPQLARPYLVVAHGAEIPVAGRIPVVGAILARVLRGGAGAVAGGRYAAAELARAAGPRRPSRRRRIPPLDVAAIPPGVDTQRFVPVPEQERPAIRRSLGLPEDGPLVVNVGRLVPRKGADVLIEAVARLRSAHPCLTLAVAGSASSAWQRAGARRCASSAGSPMTGCRRSTAVPTSSPPPTAPAGAAWSRRGSGSSSSRRPRAGSRRWPGTAAGRRRPWSTGTRDCSSRGRASRRRWPRRWNA